VGGGKGCEGSKGGCEGVAAVGASRARPTRQAPMLWSSALFDSSSLVFNRRHSSFGHFTYSSRNSLVVTYAEAKEKKIHIDSTLYTIYHLLPSRQKCLMNEKNAHTHAGSILGLSFVFSLYLFLFLFLFGVFPMDTILSLSTPPITPLVITPLHSTWSTQSSHRIHRRLPSHV